MPRHAFAAMGTEVELLLEAEDVSLLTEVEAEFRRLETVLSRFRSDSELSQLNEAGEGHVGPELLEVIELAIEARAASGGRFDPTVHDAVVAAGYDRSFEVLDDYGPGAGTAPARVGGAVAIDRTAGHVALEPGYRLDLGGIAKGWAADRALAVLANAGPTLVNAGGDVAAAGRVWPIAVEAAGGEITLGLEDGGVATSGRDRRTWVRDGEARHHLIDPVTGLPAEGDVLTVTVAAGSASEAEVLAKTLFLAGDSQRALDEAELAGIPTVLVTSAGEVLLAGGLR
jgi:FAD:protein FMN transferase